MTGTPRRWKTWDFCTAELGMGLGDPQHQKRRGLCSLATALKAQASAGTHVMCACIRVRAQGCRHAPEAQVRLNIRQQE